MGHPIVDQAELAVSAKTIILIASALHDKAADLVEFASSFAD
jgi:hypothetical protein